MALNESEVRKQLLQMVNFIKQEASEKASEIKVQGAEESNIERQNIIQEEKKKINKEFERKMKKVEVQKKIAYSNELNQSRLRLLRAREDVIEKIYETTNTRLTSLSADPAKYEQLLTNLLIQGVIKLGEDEVDVICREVDHQLVQSVIPNAQSEYTAKTGKTVNITLNSQARLAPPPTGGPGASCCGGLLLTAHGGRILLNNTLEQRLALAYEALLPEIRMSLFGRSESRKFTS